MARTRPTHIVTPDPSTSVQGQVVNVEDNPSDYGTEYLFTFDDGTTISERVEKVEAEIHNARNPQFGLSAKGINTVADLIGRTVKVWRKPMASDPSKGYLNILLLDAAPARPALAGVANGRAPRTAGAVHVPGLDDFDVVEQEEREELARATGLPVNHALRPNVPAHAPVTRNVPARTVAVPARPSAMANGAPTAAQKHAAAQEHYADHLAFVLAQVVPQWVDANVAPTAEAVNAAVATLLIQGAK